MPSTPEDHDNSGPPSAISPDSARLVGKDTLPSTLDHAGDRKPASTGSLSGFPTGLRPRSASRSDDGTGISRPSSSGTYPLPSIS